MLGEVKDVDGLLAFGVDEGDVNVAAETGECRADVVKQTGTILGHDFEKGATGGGGVIVIDARFDGDFGRARFAGAFAALEQGIERRFTVHRVRKTFLEARDFAGIQLEGVVQVDKLKGVQHDAGSVGKGVGFHDIHAPAG